MKARIHVAGGDSDGRNVKQKLKSMKSALLNSYQAEWIHLDKNNKKCRCLINPEKMTTDYDQKIISIEFDYDLHVGDTFYWDRTGKHWIVYNEHEEEEAYFRARIRRCDYSIKCGDRDYWVYLRGPVETSLIWNQKHQIEFNDLNYTIMFYIEKNEETTKFFSRHQIVKFDGHNWKVAATDKYSQQGLIEVYLEEFFDNEMEDAMIIPEEIIPDPVSCYIEGPQFVRPYDTNISYSVINNDFTGRFVVNSNKVKIVEQNETTCKIDVITGRSGEFTISYISDDNKILLNVIIKSL